MNQSIHMPNLPFSNLYNPTLFKNININYTIMVMYNPKFKYLIVIKQKYNHQFFMKLIRLEYKSLIDNLNNKDLMHYLDNQIY